MRFSKVTKYYILPCTQIHMSLVTRGEWCVERADNFSDLEFTGSSMKVLAFTIWYPTILLRQYLLH